MFKRKFFTKMKIRKEDWGERCERNESEYWMNEMSMLGIDYGLLWEILLWAIQRRKRTLVVFDQKKEKEKQEFDPHVIRLLATRKYAFASISAILFKASWASDFVSSFNVFCYSIHRNRVFQTSHGARLSPGLSSYHRSEVFTRVETDSSSTTL